MLDQNDLAFHIALPHRANGALLALDDGPVTVQPFAYWLRDIVRCFLTRRPEWR